MDAKPKFKEAIKFWIKLGFISGVGLCRFHGQS